MPDALRGGVQRSRGGPGWRVKVHLPSPRERSTLRRKSLQAASCRAHPRSRGASMRESHPGGQGLGSSPRTRSRQHARAGGSQHLWLIPAGAEPTTARCHGHADETAHPRGCGAGVMVPTQATSIAGLRRNGHGGTPRPARRTAVPGHRRRLGRRLDAGLAPFGCGSVLRQRPRWPRASRQRRRVCLTIRPHSFTAGR